MEIKILQVFYDKNGLPYKDKERTVHYPITSGTFLGASNTTQIRFYYDQLDELNESTFVAVSKLPNGIIGSEILESEYDSELQENYAILNLSQFYTQYKGDVYISLQGYQGGVRVEQDEDGIYQIYGTPTIQATGSIKLSIAYAPTFVGSGQTDNVNFQRILAALGTKLGMRAYSEHVEELPSQGSPDVFYVINDDPNNPNLANIYVWNENTEHYIWVGDNTLDLGEYYTKEQGDQFESGIDGRVTSVENELESVVSGAPSGTYATVSDLTTADPNHSKIYLVLADGKWYYYNTATSAWTAGGTYLSTAGAVPNTRKIANLQLSSDISKSALSFQLDLTDIIGTTRNQFNLADVVLGTNGSGQTERPTRAISAAIDNENNGSVITCKSLPANLKYQVLGYNDANFNGENAYTGWVTAAGTTTVIPTTGKRYVRILFGSVNDANLTWADFAGLELQVEIGNEATDYIPNKTAVDFIARDTKVDKSDFLELKEKIEIISSLTQNKFFIKDITLSKNASGISGGSVSHRAISAVINNNGRKSVVSCKHLPANLKYEVDGYETATDWNNLPYTGWVTDTSHVTVCQRQYCRILFGTVDGNDITWEDFEGLELQVEDGETATPYVPNYTAIDYEARQNKGIVKLNVCSYNVGKYSYGVETPGPTEDAISNLKAFLCKNNFDIIGVQENRDTVNGTNVNTDIYGYLFKSQMNTINWACIKSQFDLKNTGSGYFTDGSRQYCYGTATIGGKEVFIMSVHLALTWEDRQGNYTELLSILAQHKTFIVFGDFNAANEFNTGIETQTNLEYKQLTDAGYKIANGGFLGLFATCNSKFLDNICVSNDILIVDSGSMNVYDDMNSDHIPLYAELVI